MAACALLEHNPHPQPDDVREALAGNLCRCTGYQNIVDGLRRGRPPHRGPTRSVAWPPTSYRGSASDARARKTRSCSPGARATSATSPCPACCTPPCCAARTPTPASARSTRAPRGRCPAWSRPHRRRGRWSYIGPMAAFCAEPVPQTAIAVGEGALPRRGGRGRRGHRPLHRRGRLRADRRRLRGARAGRRPDRRDGARRRPRARHPRQQRRVPPHASTSATSRATSPAPTTSCAAPGAGTAWAPRRWRPRARWRSWDPCPGA